MRLGKCIRPQLLNECQSSTEAEEKKKTDVVVDDEKEKQKFFRILLQYQTSHFSPKLPTILENQLFHITCRESFPKPHTVFAPVHVHSSVSLPKTKLICFCDSAPSAAWCRAETWSPRAAGCAEAGGGGRSWKTGLGLMAHTAKSGNTRWRFRVTG